jgi:hypothetical protein
MMAVTDGGEAAAVEVEERWRWVKQQQWNWRNDGGAGWRCPHV